MPDEQKENVKRDCIDECSKAYDACMAKPGSDAEKFACKAAYDKCIANC